MKGGKYYKEGARGGESYRGSTPVAAGNHEGER